MDLKLGGCSHHSETISLLVLPGSSKVILGSYGLETWWVQSSFREDFFTGIPGVICGHPGVMWGHLSINGCMDLKLDGCSHHSERIFLLVHPGSSKVMLV